VTPSHEREGGKEAMLRTEAKVQQMLKKKVDPVYRELATKLKEPNSEIMPRLLERLMNLEQARIINALPASPDDIAKQLNLDKATVDKHMQEMFEKGLLYPGKSGWHMTRSWPELHDSAGSANPKYDSDEFFDLAFAKADERVKKQIDEVLKGETKVIRQSMRVVPRWKSINDIPGVLPYEDIRQILTASAPIAVVNCACKKIDRNRECKDIISTETCITIGRSAQHNLSRGAGRQLSYDEAMELCDSFDKYQLVHLTGNTNTMPYLICNCHNCCCGAFYRNSRTKKQLNQFSIAKSRFVATVDPAKCRGCRTCIDMRCPVGAIQMKYYPEFGEERTYINTDECIGCGLCVITCPANARTMKLVRPPEYIPSPGDLSAAIE
jgi:NAD-dependent dihydropyrimidine dehydrogenase PreA subunit